MSQVLAIAFVAAIAAIGGFCGGTIALAIVVRFLPKAIANEILLAIAKIQEDK